MKKKGKLVYGWGINDVDYIINNKSYIKDCSGKRKQIRTWICPYYQDWVAMIQRCFSKGLKINYPTYNECTISGKWKYFSNFIKWVDSQPNRDWQNCTPDKDILFKGNKHYSPETVVYVTQKVNLFILDGGKKRGDLMIGVSPCRESKKNPYKAECSDPFTTGRGYIGIFPTELEAHLAWKAKKHEYACMLADLQDDPRVAEALRQRYSEDKDWTNK